MSANTNTLFLHIKTFTGNTPPAKTEDWIALENVSTNIFSSARIAGSNGQVNNDGAPHFGNISMSKLLDHHTPTMTAKIAEAVLFDEVVIKSMTKNKGADVELVRWTFEKCLFSAQSIAAKNNGGVPSEDMTMAFESVNYKVTVPNNQGQPTTGEMSWNTIKNAKS